MSPKPSKRDGAPGAPTLLFDLDGTLTDNYAGIAASTAYALERLGAAPPSAAVLRTCVGPPLRENFARLLDTTDSTLIERAVAHYRERFSDVGWKENVAYAGIADTLTALAARGAPMYVCTAKPEIFARRIVEHFAFAPHFQGVYGADFAGRFDDKATLMAHLIASERLDPSTTAMVGDRSHDVRAARTNGVRAIGVLWGYGTRDELADADALVATPDELTELAF